MSVVLLLYSETGHVPRFNPSHDFEQVLPLGRVPSWNARLQSIAIRVELPPICVWEVWLVLRDSGVVPLQFTSKVETKQSPYSMENPT